MARRERARGAGRGDEGEGGVAALLAAGDHRGAREAAARVARDETASPEARDAARAALVSLRPDPAAAGVGLGALAFAALLVLWTVLKAS